VTRRSLLALVLVGCRSEHREAIPDPSATASVVKDAASPSTLCANLANDLAALGGTYPQLAAFRAETAMASPDCRIGYVFHCHPPKPRGGFLGAVPEPDPDGIWLYLGIWSESDPSEANAQIHTQPILPRWYLGGRRVTLHVFEGAKVTPARDAILGVLRRRGLVEKHD